MRRVIIAAIIIVTVLTTAVYILAVNQYIPINNNVVDTEAEISQNSQQNGVSQNTTTQEQSTMERTDKGTTGSPTEATGGDISSVQQTLSMEVVKQEPKLSFLAVGDIMLGRGVGMRLQKAGSYEMAFEKVASLLSQGDVVFANLESPLTENTHCLDKKGKIVLKAKPEAAKALTSVGFNLLSISNNHMLDYYETGLFDTMKVLEENHISYAGGGKNLEEARKPAIIEKNGLKIGLLAYTDMAELIFAGDPYLSFAAKADKSGLVPRKYETIREDVIKLRDQVDLLAVSLHWGTEDSFTVSPGQIEFAHKLIDDGVDIILGHHPHQFQGMEIYKGKPILYSMGNFLFDQNDPENMESFIISMIYTGTELTELSATPVRILDKSYVEIQTGQNAVNILERQTELCRRLGVDPLTDADKLVIRPY